LCCFITVRAATSVARCRAARGQSLILRKVKGVCCGGVEHALMKELPFKGQTRCRDSGFQQGLIADAPKPAVPFNLLIMQGDHFLYGEEVRAFLHFANFRKVRSCRAITRFDAAAMRFPRSFLTGSMIKRSPSVRTSSSVSRSIPNSSRIGFSINNPRLFPTAESFFRIRYPAFLRMYNKPQEPESTKEMISSYSHGSDALQA
jgi:hypothetical protein